MTPDSVPETFCIGQPRLTAGLDRWRRIDLAAYQERVQPGRRG